MPEELRPQESGRFAPAMNVVVCGDRFWPNWRSRTIVRIMSHLDPGAVVITGGAPGADTIAHEVAVKFGFTTKVIHAHWGHLRKELPLGHCEVCRRPICPPTCREVCGNAAGPIRNRKMLDLKPDLVIAFHPNLDKSSGTLDTVTEALKRKIEVKLFKR